MLSVEQISNFCVLQGSVAIRIRWGGNWMHHIKFQTICHLSTKNNWNR